MEVARFVYPASGRAPPPTATSLYTIAPCRIVDTRKPRAARRPVDRRGDDAFLHAHEHDVRDPLGRHGRLRERDDRRRDGEGTYDRLPRRGTAPGTNSVSYNPGQNRANNVLVGLTGGVLSVTNTSTGTVDLLLDVNGYYQ